MISIFDLRIIFTKTIASSEFPKMRFLFNFLETSEFNNSIKDPLISN